MKLKIGLALQKLQLTLAIIKPDIVAHPQRLKEVKELILHDQFYFVRSKELRLLRGDAERFYSSHREKFFYNRLVSFMSSGPISVHVLARDGAISRWRNIMGPTKTFRAKHETPDSIRGHFGLTDTRNATHGSDSTNTARAEIAFFFPEFSVIDWSMQSEPVFRAGNTTFCSRSWTHCVSS